VSDFVAEDALGSATSSLVSASKRQIYGDVFPLGEAVQHAFQ
jgi:hypothetical protein